MRGEHKAPTRAFICTWWYGTLTALPFLGYDLVGWSRDPGRGWAALSPGGGDEGNACFGSGWETFLRDAFLGFANATGLSMLVRRLT